MYCLVDEQNLIHNARGGIKRNVIIEGEKLSMNNTNNKSISLRPIETGTQFMGVYASLTTMVMTSTRRNKPQPS